MTRANRRICNELSDQEDQKTNLHCEQCDQALIRISGKRYVCSHCGLEQICPEFEMKEKEK